MNLLRPTLVVRLKLEAIGIADAAGELVELERVVGKVVLRAIVHHTQAMLESSQEAGFYQPIAMDTQVMSRCFG